MQPETKCTTSVYRVKSTLMIWFIVKSTYGPTYKCEGGKKSENKVVILLNKSSFTN